MYRSSLFLIVLLVLHCDIARGDFGFPSKAFGTTYESIISDDLLEKTPAWNEEDENPPVSARKAIKMAEKKMSQLIEVPDDWKGKLESLSIQRNGSRWFWRAHFVWFPKSGGFSGVPPHLDVIVLMDGTVIDPKILSAKKE